MHLIWNLIYEWSQRNLDIVFFVYGLAFVVMGIAIWLHPKKKSEFKLASILWLLAGFGLIHGTNEFLDMWAIIKGRSPALDIVRSFILMVSYLFLFEFGRHFFRICKQKYLEKITKLFGWWLTLIIGLTVFILGFISADFWKIGSIWARYLLGFPSGLLISFCLVSYYKYEKRELGPIKVKKYFFCASFFFLVYGILGGLVVPRAGFFPSNWINTDSFLLAVRIPVQVFRAICAIIIAWAICGILRIFNAVEKLQLEIAERKRTEQILQRAYDDLEVRILERTKELIKANELLKADIIERKNAEEALWESQERYRAIVENTALGITIIDTNHKIIMVNETLAKLFKNSPADFVGKYCFREYEKREAVCAHCPGVRAMASGKTAEIETQGVLDDGSRIDVYNRAIPLFGRDGALEGFIEVIENITERKKAEEKLKKAYTKLEEIQDQLIQAEKLNAVGRLASGVAHEVKNPLAIILQGVNYLENRISTKESDILETLTMLKDNIQRANKIINDLVDFSRTANLGLQPEDINSILESSLSLVKARFKFEDIDVILETKKDIPFVLGDKNKLEQVFINILLNAVQAMPGGGKIIIRSYDKQLEEMKNGIGKRAQDNFQLGEKAVIVEIEDTGYGIPEENLKRIFDPFFTTKGSTGGAGLGLSVTRNIIHMHRGLIFAESKLGEGSKITLLLKMTQRR